MTDFSGLRQTCRSRGEDPQRAIGERDRASLVLRERLAAACRNRKVNSPRVGQPVPVDPRLDGVVEFGDGVCANFGAFGLGDDAPRASNFEGMGDRRRAKIGADQRNDRAHLSEPEPDCEILRPISHHEGDSLAARHAGAQRPARILVHTRFKHAEAEALAVAKERRRIAILAGPLRHCARQNAFGVAGRLRGGLQCAQPSPSRRRCGVVVVSGRGDLVHRTVLAKSASDLGSKPRASPRALSVAFVVVFSAKRAAAEECFGSVGEGRRKECRRSEATWRRRHDRCTQRCDGSICARYYPRLGPERFYYHKLRRGVSQFESEANRNEAAIIGPDVQNNDTSETLDKIANSVVVCEHLLALGIPQGPRQ